MKRTWSEVKPLIRTPKQELIEQYEKENQYTPDSILTFNMDEEDWAEMYLLTKSGGLVAVSNPITMNETDKPRPHGKLITAEQYAALMEWKD